MFECRQFDNQAYACPNRRHCYACDQHRRYGIGRFRFHLGRCDKYWLREVAPKTSAGGEEEGVLS